MRLRAQAPRDRDLLLFTQQLAIMVGSGLPIIDSLKTLRKHSNHSTLQCAIETALTAIANGSSLSEGLRASPRVFNTFYTAVIDGAERGGTLEESLDLLCQTISSQREIKQCCIAAMTYPLIVITILALTIIGLMIYVVPTFEDLFAQSGQALPWLTERIVNVSRGLTEHLAELAAALVGIPATVMILRARGEYSRPIWLDRRLLQAPLILPLLHARYGALIARTLSSLTRAGIPIIESLQVSSRIIRNQWVARELMAMRVAIIQGSSLSVACSQAASLPPLLSQLIAIGELSGRLEESLTKAATHFESDFRSHVTSLTRLAEPCLVLTVGCVVGVFVVAMYLPIFELGTLVAR